MATVHRDPYGIRPAWWAGVRACVPMAIGVAPFGIALGAVMAASDLTLATGLASILMFAGSAQLAVVRMLDGGASPLLVVLTGLLINFRFAVYGAALARLLPGLPARFKAAMAVALVDQTYLMTASDARDQPRTTRERTWFYAGASALLCTVWTASQLVGMVGGVSIPAGVGLGAAAPLSLAGLLGVSKSERSMTTAAIVAALVMLTLSRFLGHAALLAGIAAGAAIAPAEQEVAP